MCVRLNKNIAGEFDFDILANEFEMSDLLEWGFEDFELAGVDEGFSDKNKEINIDDIDNESIIKLKFTGDDYLKIIQRLSDIRKNDETNEILFVKMLSLYENRP